MIERAYGGWDMDSFGLHRKLRAYLSPCAGLNILLQRCTQAPLLTTVICLITGYRIIVCGKPHPLASIDEVIVKPGGRYMLWNQHWRK